jgi:DNA-binding transcriptional MerR regulator
MAESVDLKEPRYDVKELSDRAGVTPRTVHFYIQQGLLRPAGSPGPGARYTEGHVNRLRVIRRLQHEHLPLAEIRRQLAALNDEAVASLLNGAKRAPRQRKGSALEYVRGLLEPAGRVAEEALPQAAARPSATLRQMLLAAEAAPANAGLQAARAPATDAPERSQWDRVVLAPDVELHVRRPLSRDENRRVERLIKIAREILEEGIR